MYTAKEIEAKQMSFITTLKSIEFLTPEAFNSYMSTLLETNTDEDEDKLSDYYEVYTLDEDGLEGQWNECHEFLKKNAEIINQLVEDGYEVEQILYDFLMTRNGEGSGFWDGDYPHDIGLELTEAAHKFAPVSLYVGDDGGVYVWNS